MKKIIYLSVVCAVALSAETIDLGVMEVNELLKTKSIDNVSRDEVKNADLAEALHKQVPSINLIRRSGIANDITLRGQKRDNIVMTVDGSKINGACPNRMDPPSSHIVVGNVDSIVVTEGPFDVENFGTLSGSVKVKTKKPSKEFKGELESTVGSFGYRKVGTTLSGGTDKVKVLVTGSYEKGGQYKDGNGDTLAEQLKKATDGTGQAGTQYADKYKGMDSFVKKTFMAKTFVNVANNQNVEASVTLNRSDNILYPNSKMDALYDDSEVFNFQYTLDNISKYSKRLQIQAYLSHVDHPMSTIYRKSSGANSANEKINKLETKTSGVKIINDMKINNDIFTIGADINDRNWDGTYTGYGTSTGITGRKSIDDVSTRNNALFMKYNKNIDAVNVKAGARYNHTVISTEDTTYADRKYNFLDANIVLTLNANDATKYFMGLGSASRVPDARELYFRSSGNGLVGTTTLDEVKNTELDVGFEKTYDNLYFKAKAFYSILDNYIYFNKDNAASNAFENIDAKVYGLEFSGIYDINDALSMDFGGSYQRGKKDHALQNQTDRDLADMTPLKLNLALNYDYDATLTTKVELMHTDTWNNYDEDNGEQKLPSYSVVNLKATKSFNKSFELTVGIDNVFDKAYAVSNTYSDLTLLSDGTTGEVMLLNEPGRYLYTNIKYKF